MHGSNDNGTLSVVEALGHLYKMQNRLNEAESMFVRALTGGENALGLNIKELPG